MKLLSAVVQWVILQKITFGKLFRIDWCSYFSKPRLKKECPSQGESIRNLLKNDQNIFCKYCFQLPSVITHELFVNICSWEQMPAPKSENDPVPVMAGELQEKKEGKTTYSVVDIIVNPVVTKGVSNSKDRKNLLAHVAMDYLENTKKIQVSRKYKNFKRSFKGDAKTLRQYLRYGKDHGITVNSGKQTSVISESPGSLLKQLSSIAVAETQLEGSSGINLFEKPKKGLIEEVSSTNFAPQPVIPVHTVLVKDAENSKPRRVVVLVDLPNSVLSSKDCQLDVCEVSWTMAAVVLVNFRGGGGGKDKVSSCSNTHSLK